ncbi:MAG: ABC transporter permease [Vicinamibacterales bacterium]
MASALQRFRNLHPAIDIGFKALTRNRLQTALTMLGITVGVATVLAMMAVGAGAQQSIEQQVRAAGLNQLTITAGNWRLKSEDKGGVVAHQGDADDTMRLPVEELMPAMPDLGDPFGGQPFAGDVVPILHPEDDPMEKHDHPLAWQRLGDLEAGLGAAATLSFADAEAIREMPGVQYVACGVHGNARIHYTPAGDAEGKRWFTRMHGTDLHLLDIKRTWTLRHGRFFTEDEQDDRAMVLVLGSVVAEKLFGPEVNPVGRDVTLWNQTFEVVGVVTSASWVVRPAPGDDEFDAVYMPYTTTHQLLNLTKLNDITVTAASSGDVSGLAKRITDLLRERHGITVEKPDDFTISTQATRAVATGGLPPDVAAAIAGNVKELERVTLEQLAGTLERASSTMRWLLAAVAAVSLIVGGIGIMNITLLSVTERTKEIGLRMAVGARGRDVTRQFLTEAVAISLAGGAVGVVLGVAASYLISSTLRWATLVSPAAVLVAFGVSAAVGVLFGWYPARRAAELDPIDALRHE